MFRKMHSATCIFVIFMLFCDSVIGYALSADSVASKNWTHSLLLGAKNEVELYWKSYYDDKDGHKWLEMQLSAPTNGYIGLGFTQHSGMDGADIVIGWVTADGQVLLKDFHGEGNAQPVIDPEALQSYQLISGEENGMKTMIQFRRRWDTCDDDYDIRITNDTMRLIWAYGRDDPELVGNTLLFARHEWHNRGVRSVFIQDQGVISPFPDDPVRGHQDPKYWDFTMQNNTIDSEETTYFCKIVKIPDTRRKAQMIGMRPLLVPENKELVHHIGLYECIVPPELGGTDAIFREHLQHPGERCFTASMPPEWAKYCHTFLITWAAGSEGDMFPEHIGNPIGEEHNGATYFMMEMHYNNPERRAFQDSSGVRVFYTDKPRTYDSSTMLIGHRISPFQVVPPGQRSFKNYGLCSSECTAKTLPASGIKFVSVLLHGHLAATKVRLRHFRNGTELAVISQDERYDYNYQQTRFFPKEVTVLPGDELITECDYDTVNRTEPTLGGLTAKDEMCLSIILYYPRIELDDCRSQPELNSFFAPLAIENVKGKILSSMRLPYDPTKWSEEDRKLEPLEDSFALEDEEGGDKNNFFSNLNITEPSYLANRSVVDHMRELHWKNAHFARSVQDSWKNGKHYAFCTGHGRRRIHLDNYVTSMPKMLDQPIISPDTDKAKRKCSSNSTFVVPAAIPQNSQWNDIGDNALSNFQQQYPNGGYDLPGSASLHASSNSVSSSSSAKNNSHNLFRYLLLGIIQATWLTVRFS